jgi:23S rRNA pseudouridine1911/1915/1917 synthase
MNIPVAYEDDWLVIVDKPAGLLTIPAPGENPRSLSGILNKDLEERGLSYRLHPCHRLDRETSGLIIYAKGKSVQKKMMDLFKERRIKKTYVAFVQGIIKEDNGQINRPVERTGALTRFRVLRRRGDFTVLEVNPQTGRKNQIRIHFKAIGHPLVGETRFAFRKDYKLRAKRLCLHAQGLEFTHPITGKIIRQESPLPGDLEKFLQLH